MTTSNNVVDTRPVLHVVMPRAEVARETPLPRETVTAFLRRSDWATRGRKYGWQFKKGLPTILEMNGEAVLRRDWRRREATAARSRLLGWLRLSR
ncbi:hypothetical protein [Bradyrhizobium sp. ERR14]|uniref:hypothetical protein n=1 Tax=Bradyrhizobium sp. ERR14 TaxID=2663837 RepID=UPI001609B0D7|nr:hypothetical protein [Bradyrhizobium sp. ERR14]MBB4395164.1 hypothetical protein [Bradyrhizobium sp. ERR14]